MIGIVHAAVIVTAITGLYFVLHKVNGGWRFILGSYDSQEIYPSAGEATQAALDHHEGEQ